MSCPDRAIRIMRSAARHARVAGGAGRRSRRRLKRVSRAVVQPDPAHRARVTTAGAESSRGSRDRSGRASLSGSHRPAARWRGRYRLSGGGGAYSRSRPKRLAAEPFLGSRGPGWQCPRRADISGRAGHRRRDRGNFRAGYCRGGGGVLGQPRAGGCGASPAPSGCADLGRTAVAQPRIRLLVTAAMIAGMQADGSCRALPAGQRPTHRLRRRIALLATQFPNDGWPDFSDAAMTATLEQLARHQCSSTVFGALEQLGPASISIRRLRAQLFAVAPAIAPRRACADAYHRALRFAHCRGL